MGKYIRGLTPKVSTLPDRFETEIKSDPQNEVCGSFLLGHVAAILLVVGVSCIELQGLFQYLSRHQ